MTRRLSNCSLDSLLQKLQREEDEDQVGQRQVGGGGACVTTFRRLIASGVIDIATGIILVTCPN